MLWHQLGALDQALGEVAHEAKLKGEWRVTAHLQACRARLNFHIALHAPEFTEEEREGQLTLVLPGDGRPHDTLPAE